MSPADSDGRPAAARETVPTELSIRAITGIPDLRPGDDLAGLLGQAAPWLQDHDILVVTSKAISKVEDRLIAAPTEPGEREAARLRAIDGESVSVVAQRGNTKVVRTRQGLTMAAAGVDGSNVRSGEIALLPVDPDASAAGLKAAMAARFGVEVAVVVTDTVGRPWRAGLVDIAIGAAGIEVLRDLRGGNDTHGHPLAMTAMAQIDQLASASELVRGKLAQVPAAVIRGVPWTGDRSFPGNARELIRPLAEDMFALGTRDVVPASTAEPVRTDVPVGRRALEAAMTASNVAAVAAVELDADPVVVLTSAADPMEFGVALGRFLVALRAEGLAATRQTATTAAGLRVELRVGVAADYQGTASG